MGKLLCLAVGNGVRARRAVADVPVEAAVAVRVGPDRERVGSDGSDKERPEIPAVETVGRVPVHEEDLAVGERPATLPGRQWAALAVALARVAIGVVEGDNGRALTADRVTGNRQHALE
ncbi:hypothetical protein FQZ97_1196160 [compost metagenome]